jgi:HAD superfamily hydrolase (TIGR01484 family)
VAIGTEVALAYVTGRHLELALEGVRDARLPEPAFTVCDVGTSIHEREGDGWTLDEAYRTHMREARGGLDAAEIRAAVDGLGLTLQSSERQAEFKVSFEFTVDRSAAEVEAALLERLEGMPVRPVVSRAVGGGGGLVDLLPAGVAKDTAVRHLRDRLGLTDDDVLFAGDTGNDRDALLGGWLAVLVGNASDGFREEIREAAARLGLTDRVHLARAAGVEGVLEGCRRSGFLG